MRELLVRINSSRRAVMSLKIISHVASVICAAVFGIQLLLSVLDGEYFTAIGVALSAAIGLAMVTVMRKLINAPRPYEFYSFYVDKPREKSGESFPSRHAYSSFVIAVLAWLLHPAVSISLLVASICISAARVLLGIHFVRDALVGAALGILSGVLGILIIVI